MKRRTVRKREPTARRVRRKTGRALAAFRRRVAQGTLTAEDRAAIKRGEVKTTAEMVAVGFPAGGPTRKQLRGWSAREFLEWKRQDRQQTHEFWQRMPAVDGGIPGSTERRPLLPPPPHSGGRAPGSHLLTNEVLQATLDARGLQGRWPSVKE